jgi:hypothetical protein
MFNLNHAELKAVSKKIRNGDRLEIIVDNSPNTGTKDYVGVVEGKKNGRFTLVGYTNKDFDFNNDENIYAVHKDTGYGVTVTLGYHGAVETGKGIVGLY